MAGRQFKEGLDYFPFDTSFFMNDKIQLIEAEFGVKGVNVAIRLLCKVYNEKGYYYQWGGDECLLLSKAAGAEFVPSAVNEIVDGLVRRCFFDKRCFDRFGILTSLPIQEVYIAACERRKQITLFKEIVLLEKDKIPINVDIISINVDINTINDDKKGQSKVNKIKRKGSKESMGKMDGDAVTSRMQTATAEFLPTSKKQEKHPPVPAPPPLDQQAINFRKFQKWVYDNAPLVAKLKEPFTQQQFEQLKVDFELTTIQELLLAMHNYKPLLTKNTSANLTFRAWAKREKQLSHGISKNTPPSDDELMQAVADGLSRSRTKQVWE